MASEDISLLDPENKITWNHKEIKEWVEKHGGKPAIFDDPTAITDKIGIRIDFPGHKDERYMHSTVVAKVVSWEEFFKIFEKRKLAFVYGVTMAYKLIPRDSVSA